MKIIEQTPTVLKLETTWTRQTIKQIIKNSPSFLLCSILYVSLGLISLSFIAVVAKVIRLDCDRGGQNQMNCQITSAGLLTKEITPIRNEIERAELQVMQNSDGYNSYRILLISGNKIIPLTPYYSQGMITLDSLTKNIDKINNFIQRLDQKSLSIAEDNRLVPTLFGLMIILMPIILIYVFQRLKLKITYIFDKNLHHISFEGIVIWKKHEFILEGKSVENTTVSFSKIQEVQVIETTHKNGRKTYQIDLMLKSSSPITLDISDEESEDSEIAKTINEFLGISST
jgi:hypothetical protein